MPAAVTIRTPLRILLHSVLLQNRGETTLQEVPAVQEVYPRQMMINGLKTYDSTLIPSGRSADEYTGYLEVHTMALSWIS